MSWWVWLYFVVTIGLTLLVLLVWWYSSRNQNTSILQYLEDKGTPPQSRNSKPNSADETDEGGIDAKLIASLHTETSIASEGMWPDRSSAMGCIPEVAWEDSRTSKGLS